jgi:hypothetical protein
MQTLKFTQVLIIGGAFFLVSCAKTAPRPQTKPVAVETDEESSVMRLTDCEPYIKVQDADGDEVKEFAYINAGCIEDTKIVIGMSQHKTVRVGSGSGDPSLLKSSALAVAGKNLVLAADSSVIVGTLRENETYTVTAPMLVMVEGKDGYRVWDKELDFGNTVTAELVLDAR